MIVAIITVCMPRNEKKIAYDHLIGIAHKIGVTDSELTALIDVLAEDNWKEVLGLSESQININLASIEGEER